MTGPREGIDIAMMIVLRQEPRNNSIISAVKAAAMTPSLTTPLTAARTNRIDRRTALPARRLSPSSKHSPSLLRSGGDAESGSAAVLEDAQQGAANAILPNDVLLWM